MFESNGASGQGFVGKCLTCRCRGKDAVAALIKRLAHRNANVQLYTLEVRSTQIGEPPRQAPWSIPKIRPDQKG